MAKGRIAKYIADQGFGYITPDQGREDVRFRKSEVKTTDHEIGQGALVEYEPRRNNRTGKLEAVWVRIVGGAPNSPRGQSRAPTTARTSSSPGEATLPPDCVFDTFYNEHDCLKKSLFCEAPQLVAEAFARAELKTVQLRRLFLRYRAFALPLGNGRITFPKALEHFGTFYVEGVVRQNNRTDNRNKPILPHIVKEFVDQHKGLIQKNEKEMLGFLKYLTNVMCYFVEPDSRHR